ncbi:MAG: hypothetical protein M1821_002931 [Bathelium mastoideum]|nr:MAG: hypothetical protein M1821_002931 [Bathelium mastoideum]
MKSNIISLSLLLSAFPLALASTCNMQTATDITGGGNPFNSSTDDSSFVTKRAVLPRSPHISTFASTARTLTNYLQRRRNQARGVGNLTPRQSSSIDCTDAEQCYSDPSNDILLCLNPDTGDFTDNYGDSGNYNTGVVTAPDGSVTTIPGAGFGAGGPGGASGVSATNSALSSAETSLGESTGGAVTSTNGIDPSSTGSGQSSSQVTSTAGGSAGSSPSVSGSSNNGQPTGHVAGGAAAGRAGVDVAVALGALGLMAAVI